MAREGLRPTLILLPAVGCDAGLYGPEVEALADLVEPLPLVIAEPNMGRASRALLGQAPARFLLAGTSYGASLALEVAAEVPGRLLGLWLMGCNPGPHPDPAAARQLARRAAEGEAAAVIEDFAAGIVEPAGPRGPAAADAFRAMARGLGGEALALQIACLADRGDRRPDLPQLGCPTLLLWGEKDRFADAGHGRLMEREMPDAKLEILPGCGHLPTLEYPAESTAAARRWIARAVAAAGNRI